MAVGKDGNQEQDLTSYQPSLKPLSKEDLTLTELLGAGGFGEVRKARHKTLGTVAVKICQEGLLKNKDTLQRITKEVQRMTDTSFTMYVVQILGTISPDMHTPCWIVMEYMELGSLRSFLESLQDSSVPSALRVFMLYEMSLGMNYLHSLKPAIIHRDLKLANVFLALGYKAKIGDLGLATVDTSDSNQIPYGGTVSHMPPEQEVTTKFDVFSFGITTWELSTGQYPFHNCIDQTALIKISIECNQRPEMELVPDNELDIVKELMKESWHQDPEKRPTFEGIKAKFEEYMGGPSPQFEKQVGRDRTTLDKIRRHVEPRASKDATDSSPIRRRGKGDSLENAPGEANKPQRLRSREGDAVIGHQTPPSTSPSPSPSPSPPLSHGSDLLPEMANMRMEDNNNVRSPVQESDRKVTPPPVQQDSTSPSGQQAAGYSLPQDCIKVSVSGSNNTIVIGRSQNSPVGYSQNPSGAQFNQLGSQFNPPAAHVHPTGAQFNLQAFHSDSLGSQSNPPGAQWNPQVSHFNAPGAQWNPQVSHFNAPGAQWNPQVSHFNAPGAHQKPSGSQSNPSGAQWNLLESSSAPSAASSVTVRDPNGKVTEDLVNDLSPLIAGGYKKLGRALGLTEQKIGNIEADNNGDQEEMGHQVMVAWMQASHDISRGTLAAALKKANLMVVLRKM